MSIKIVEDGPEITVTRSEWNRYKQDYDKRYHLLHSEFGYIPTIEEYIRSLSGKGTLLNEDVIK